jgi:hypothetical protein
MNFIELTTNLKRGRLINNYTNKNKKQQGKCFERALSCWGNALCHVWYSVETPPLHAPAMDFPASRAMSQTDLCCV